MTGMLIAALLFPLAGRALRARAWSEAYLLGVGVVGALLFLLPFRIGLAAAGLLAVAGLVRVRLPEMRKQHQLHCRQYHRKESTRIRAGKPPRGLDDLFTNRERRA